MQMRSSALFDWDAVIIRAVAKVSTPCFIFAATPLANALAELNRPGWKVPVRHLYSVKTHPLPQALALWRRLGLGVEVVSESEFVFVRQLGFTADNIVVNGVAKHAWIQRHRLHGLTVHLDSEVEAAALSDLAAADAWRVGIRCHLPNERDPDEPQFPAQFGMSVDEVTRVAAMLSSRCVRVSGVHCHIGTNLANAEEFDRAVDHLATVCRAADLAPVYADLGGGLPAPVQLAATGRCTFSLDRFRAIVDSVPARLPTVREVWCENGRFMTAGSGVLVVRVLDKKTAPECDFLICDGGRTNQALVSDWETHRVRILPDRPGDPRLTTVCGPTCMAFDRLLRARLPDDVQPGDLIVWFGAGAYHLSWETRFSAGLCAVVWCDEDGEVTVARRREPPTEWLRHWLTDSR